MAVSLSSLVGFNSTLPANYQHVSRSSIRTLPQKASSLRIIGLGLHIKERRKSSCFSVADSDRLATDTTNEDPVPSNSSVSDTQVSSANPSQTSSSNEPAVRQNLESKPKKAPLTARERLKAARVLSRYNTVAKSSEKSEMGSTVLDALKESDKGKKRSGLPEAPTNMFDDSDRGLSQGAWKFSFPGGADLFAVVLSVVLISTVMFTTTYIVWKAGAIHFNEY